MTFQEWWDKEGEHGYYAEIWNAAIEQAALYMLSRKVSASEFYAAELRKLKSPC